MGLWSRIVVTAVVTAATAAAFWLGVEVLHAGQTAAIAIASIAATTVGTLGSAWASRAWSTDDPISAKDANYGVMANAHPVAGADFHQSPARTTEIGSPVNHDSQREQLKVALEADHPNVILVHGKPGTGKSTLVWWVLQELGLMEKARRYELPNGPFDARALLDEIEAGALPRTALRPGEDVLSRIEVAVEQRNDSSLIIVVDGAQHLLEGNTRAMISLELDEALDMVVNGSRRVKVIFVLPELPVSQKGWVDTAAKVWVDGLPKDHFRAYLNRLDTEGKYGLAELTPTQHGALYDVLQGMPQLANLFRAVLAMRLSEGKVAAPAQLLAQITDGELPARPSDEKEQLLARELVGCLSSDQLGVVEALAAYGTPVTGRQVKDLLVNDVPAGQVSMLLPELADLDVIGKTSDRYYLPTLAISNALLRLADRGPARLRHQAANQLSLWRTPEDRILRPDDLQVHFAELAVRIEAGLWGSSYELINRIDKALDKWNATDQLLKQREAIAGRLDHPYREMVNYNALGSIYMARGRSGEAQEAFDSALRKADEAGLGDGRRKILVNLAALRWDSGDTSCAQELYENALAMAGEHDDAADRMAAQAGLADCLRRWGDFHGAISKNKQALLRRERGEESHEVGAIA